MAPIDIIFAVILLGFGIRGLFRGFVSSIVATLGLLVSIVCAFLFYPNLANLFAGNRDPEIWHSIFAFVLIFLGVGTLSLILEQMLSSLLVSSKLSVVNRLMGFLLGLFKGIILSCLLLVFIRIQPIAWIENELLSGSKLIPYFEKFLPLLSNVGKVVSGIVDAPPG